MGPDPKIGGGMASALEGLFQSPLAGRYQLDFVATYDSVKPLRRLAVYCIALLRLAAWSLRGRGRIVHVHATVRGSMYRKSVCVLAAKALRRRVVLHIHSGASEVASFAASRDSLSLGLFRAALTSADVALAVSAASAEALERTYRLAEVVVVPNAAPSVAPFVREPESPDRVRVAYLGGFANVAKGADVLIEALELALLREPRLRITLAGPGELPAESSAFVAEQPAIEWAGWLGPAEKDALLRVAEVFVMPSRSEGLPMALLEAMAYGTATVATEVGGIPEVVDSGVDGLLVPPENPEALAGALCELAADAELRERLSAGARRRVETLDAVEVADRLDALYASLA
jgi:glycosyltransferase involved in cell wall biosynthesis